MHLRTHFPSALFALISFFDGITTVQAEREVVSPHGETYVLHRTINGIPDTPMFQDEKKVFSASANGKDVVVIERSARTSGTDSTIDKGLRDHMDEVKIYQQLALHNDETTGTSHLPKMLNSFTVGSGLDSKHYIVVERKPGNNLHKILDGESSSRASFPEITTVGHAAKIIHGLTKILSIAHSDPIKLAWIDGHPGNVMVDENLNVYLVDADMMADITQHQFRAFPEGFAAPEMVFYGAMQEIAVSLAAQGILDFENGIAVPDSPIEVGEIDLARADIHSAGGILWAILASRSGQGTPQNIAGPFSLKSGGRSSYIRKIEYLLTGRYSTKSQGIANTILGRVIVPDFSTSYLFCVDAVLKAHNVDHLLSGLEHQGLRDILTKAMQPIASERYRTMDEFVNDLKPLLDDLTPLNALGLNPQ